MAGTEAEQAIEQCIAVGAKGAVIYSSGFAELGEAGAAQQQRLVARARAGGLRLFGPNTQGVANFATGAVLHFSTMINEEAPQDGPGGHRQPERRGLFHRLWRAAPQGHRRALAWWPRATRLT